VIGKKMLHGKREGEDEREEELLFNFSNSSFVVVDT